MRTRSRLAASRRPRSRFEPLRPRNAIRAIARARPDFLVGAGTLVRPDVVEAVVEAGAQFTVSPGFSRQVGEAAARHGLPYIPGVANATDIQLCLEAGHSLVKLFPVEALGGLRLLRALAGRSTIARRDFAEVTRLASDAAQQVALVRASPAATV